MKRGSSAHQSLWCLWAVAAAGLVVLGACTSTGPSPDTQATANWLSTTWPQAAATLTAWPTPPALVTRLPTPTAAPQSLWTAEAQPGLDATPAALNTPAEPQGAPVGSLPPPVRLLIPRLAMDVPVVEVSWSVINENGTWRTEWETADHAAGHHRGSANPGEAGNMVLSGHHNTKGEVFRLVSEVGQPGNALRLGDEIVVISEDGHEYTYNVVQWDRFQEEAEDPEQQQEHARYLAPTQSPTLTLVTCWPYESNTHRVVVVAELRP
jgi:sortase A